MKVILLQDVAKLGRRHEVVEVPDGYGVNKLIPKGLAKPATPENLKSVAARTAAVTNQKEAAHEAFARLAEKLKEVTVTISANANGEGKLFQAVHERDVAAALTAATGMTVAATQIVLDEQIKHIGEVTVTVKEGQTKIAATIQIVAA